MIATKKLKEKKVVAQLHAQQYLEIYPVETQRIFAAYLAQALN